MPSLPIISAAPTFDDQAQTIAKRWQLQYVSDISSGLVLLLDESGLQLKQLNEPKTGGVRVDFASDAMTYRRQQSGAKKEAIARAVGLKAHYRPNVLDATAGLGRDAFILANLGCKVQMLERNNVVAALLEDGLSRAATHAEIGTWVSQRLQFFGESSIAAMQQWQAKAPDVVYLDPMFPHRKKAALVKKEMRLFQQLLGPDEDADLLLAPALAIATKRVVVKRPSGAPYLADQKPQVEMQGKANRFDIYLCHQSDVEESSIAS
ncbi:class I SAM-dependent methyltransferase [Alteromonadaceae bacterium BrNp21-10]|nr:class I SAM-dependent methyltransferase [Alteromonadaceae bacterium BrNp21-10]